MSDTSAGLLRAAKRSVIASLALAACLPAATQDPWLKITSANFELYTTAGERSGRDLARLKLRDYRRKLGVVLQDDFLFDGTIAANVAFSRPRASKDDIAAACRAAGAGSF